MTKVVCYYNPENGRSRHVAHAMEAGFVRHGLQVRCETSFAGVAGDLAVAYGWRNKDAFNSYVRAGGHALYIDMGFWDRKPAGSPREGYHKVVLDDWCPTKTMRRGCPEDRFSRLGVQVREARAGKTIVVAGMSGKSARDHGYASNEWEAKVIDRLRKVTRRPIVYRPKPSWKEARPIAGAGYSIGSVPIADVLAGAHMLVSHHSNAAVDAIVAGVAVYCEQGVASLLSVPSLETVDDAKPATIQERLKLLQDIAWCQWTPSEMRSGECWDHYRELICQLSAGNLSPVSKIDTKSVI